MASSPPLPFPLLDEGPGPYRLLLGGRRRAVLALHQAVQAPEAAQQARLTAVLAATRDSAFGRAHGLSRVRTLAELRRAVPIQAHAALHPWLQRVAQGERGVLTTAPVQMLVETSGTTGAPKHLPVTAAWAATVADAQALWMLGFVREHPGVVQGKALTLVSPAVHARSPGGLPIGSNTGRMHAEQPWYVRLRYPVPDEVLALSPSDLKLYATLRFALPAEVRSITTANPSTVLLLQRRLQAWRAELEADLREGTLRRGPAADLDPGLRRRLERRLGRVRTPRGDGTLAGTWPLAAVACWVDGPAAWYAAHLRRLLGPQVPLHPIGVTASEGYFAVPLSGSWPGGVLFLSGHVLELVDEAGEARAPWAVEEGERLRLVVSTEAGLLRYDMGDLVEVVGRCARAPLVRFLGKAGRFLNVLGERVTEAQVAAAAQAADAALGEGPTGLTASVEPALEPAYRVFVEGLAPPAAQAWVAAFDAALGGQNLEYAGRRRSGRLGAARAEPLPPGTYLRWRAARVARGAPDGQVKDPVLAIDAAERALLLAAAGRET